MSTLRPETVVFLDATHLSVHFYKKNVLHTAVCTIVFDYSDYMFFADFRPSKYQLWLWKKQKNNFLTTCLTLPMAELYANLPKSSYEMCK